MRGAAGRVPNITQWPGCEAVPALPVIGDTGVQFSARLIFTFVPDNDLLFVWPAASIILSVDPTQQPAPPDLLLSCCLFDRLAACVCAASSAGEGSEVGATRAGHAAVTAQQGLHSGCLRVSTD